MAGNVIFIIQDGCSFDGKCSVSGFLDQGNKIDIRQSADECISRLHVTDPRLDKKRIEDTKGGLLTECYDWVLQHDDFRRWRDDQAQRLLWIKGDPGKGKTMLLCGIINELEATPVQGTPLSYFFCEASDERLRSATAVLRGLISMLLKQDSRLIRYIKEEYDEQGSQLFDGTNAWYAMSDIFMKMLKDSKLQGVRLIIDALDECLTDLEKLLTLITETSQSTTAKWLVSSRHCPRIEEDLCHIAQNQSLEINKDLISTAVSRYIEFKVSKLKQLKGYKDETANEITDQKHHVELRKQILALVATTFRPLSLTECIKLIECHNRPDDPEFYQFIVSTCGSFLAIREDTIYFVHQSAKEFLLEKSLDVLSEKLKCDIYELKKPGCSIKDISPPSPDPLASLKYVSTYWVDHDEAAGLAENPALGDLQEDGTVHNFLKNCYLRWIEAQSLINGVPQAVVALQKLLTVLTIKGHDDMVLSVAFSAQASSAGKTINLWDQAMGHCQQKLEGHSNEVSSVAFSAKGLYLASGSVDTTIKLWDTATGDCQQTLEGHSGWVRSVAFSVDGQQMASVLDNKTIKLWDTATGQYQQILEDHSSQDRSGQVQSVVFSADGQY
ncbi:hnwd3 [Moelleriella libera RCEF 2490]|uniref:Hnwd3 n=1 Tax=Moelleriella libera RCEF 2490 TaxID=1081109 RepID=A0A162IDG8_9HYPO|nr:hnwd3 [Moelleriella libera RCEF 2490]